MSLPSEPFAAVLPLPLSLASLRALPLPCESPDLSCVLLPPDLPSSPRWLRLPAESSFGVDFSTCVDCRSSDFCCICALEGAAHKMSAIAVLASNADRFMRLLHDRASGPQ